MTLHVESLTYDPRPEYPFVVIANRYWDPPSYNEDGFTLILAHGTGFHREQWEPTLKHLFSLAKGSRTFPIREAWSIECPNHGDSAILNEKVILRGGYDLVFSWGEYTHVLYLFMTQNKDIQFSSRRIIAIGHSMGAVSLALSQGYPRAIPFAHLVLCEPMVAPTDVPKDDPKFRVGGVMIAAAAGRRDIWPSKKDALETLKSRKSFAIWNDEVLRIYVEYGLRELPTDVYPDKKGVTLKCPKLQEAACYRDAISARRVYEFLPTLCTRMPVHVIWGAIDDAIHRAVKDLVTDPAAGRKVSSISYVEGAGHLIVQMSPKGLAEAIFSAVSQASDIQSKL